MLGSRTGPMCSSIPGGRPIWQKPWRCWMCRSSFVVRYLRLPATIIVDGGIRLIPFIAGEVDRVLELYAKGNPLAPTFAMPG